MTQKVWKIRKITPVILGASILAASSPTLAQTQSDPHNGGIIEQIEQYSQERLEEDTNQVTNVNQLRDVSPTDWAYEALRSLVERYGCIVGYPNQTYRGNQSLSRYEFAAGLNACLNQIERLIASSETVAREDIETLQRLTQEFEAELATLGGRVDNLEGRVAFLEDHQFSTTSKLAGEVILALGSIFAGDANQNTVLGNRTRLELNTSFTGEDLLFTRLSTGNFPSFAEETGTFQGDLAFAEPADNDLGLEVLFYTFPVGENTEVLLGATGTAADDIANTVNILDGDGATGAISLFGTRNPIYYQPADAGLGIIHRLGEQIEISAGYLANPANEPTPGSGLFNGPYSALGQILFTPIENLNLALTYVHSYNQSDTETGSTLANLQFLTEDLFGQAVPTVSDSYGIQVSWAISDRFVVGGWGALSKVTSLSTLGGQLDRGTQDVWNWAVTLAFPDLGQEGNLAGIIVGMEPWVASSTIETLGDDEDTSLHLEAFYQYQVTDNISLTPGVVWITAPNNNNDNDDLVIGTIRTTFSF
ncbi:carbohydrate porin [Pleurocapsales cyanobacterium LEGE 06147]|nr:carbohydrate porin [Pleurocapsales cyanobacterium LEGE 06147]